MFVYDNLNFKITKYFQKDFHLMTLQNAAQSSQFNARLKAQQLKSVLEQIISNNYDVFMEHYVWSRYRAKHFIQIMSFVPDNNLKM